MKSVIISVSDRTGILEFAQKLRQFKFNIIATSGTQNFLASNGIECHSVFCITGFPEILSGRVKTLHPKLLGAILADAKNATHLAELKEFNIPLIDIVVCNLYPFEITPGIENIDIGGVTLIRAAAKNYKRVACITHPSQYDPIIRELTEHSKITDQTRLALAHKAFKLTSTFDTQIERWFSLQCTAPTTETLSLNYEKVAKLQYGENPHQKASVYKETESNGLSVVNAIKLQGKEISFNNLSDLDAAISVVKSFNTPCACILKHATPCGVAIADRLVDAYKAAYRTDPISSFGGIVAFNREVDKTTAEEVAKTFIVAIIAPDYTNEAMEILGRKKNMAVMQINLKNNFDPISYRWINGGLLVQDNDIGDDNTAEWTIVTNNKPTNEEFKAMEFGFKIVRFIKSNAICITTDKMTLGIGGGQPNRVGSLKVAIKNMKDSLLTNETPKAIASDAFFPFRDSIDLAYEAGIKAIIQPGGSMRDQEVIDACNELGIATIFTHKRHFKH